MCSTFQRGSCYSACNFGSDSNLMQSLIRVALPLGESAPCNKHFAAPVWCRVGLLSKVRSTTRIGPFSHLAQLRLDLTARRRRELAGLTSYRLSCLSLGFRLLEPIAALTTIAVNLPAHCALTDAQNFGDAFLARPTLAQRINLAAILILYSPVLAHRQPLVISRGYPFRRLTQLCTGYLNPRIQNQLPVSVEPFSGFPSRCRSRRRGREASIRRLS